MPRRYSGRMMGCGTSRFAAWGGLGLLLGVLSCASTPADTQGGAKTLEDLRVEREGEATVVTLVGLEDPVYTAYLQQDPQRITVDLTAVQPAELREPVAVYDGLVEEVSVSPISKDTVGAATRVELQLATDAEYAVEQMDDGLAIRVTPVGGLASAPGTESERLDAEAEAAGGAAATKLTAVDVERVDGGVVLHLRADGAIESAGSFTLEAPERLVIDLPGLTSGLKRDQMAVDSPQATRLRIGQHENMVRVVVDGGPEAHGFQGRRVVPAGGGLVVALGSGSELDAKVEQVLAAAGPAQAMHAAAADAEAEAAAMDLPAAPAPAGKRAELASIQGVEFDAQAERDRITVVADRPVDYVVYQPDPDTVVVSLPHARLQPQLDPRIAPEPGGPVSLVTAFEQPEMKVPEVRIVVERAPGLVPEVSREGSLVVIEFARGTVAQTPPVLASVPAEPGASAPAALAPDATAATAPTPAGGKGHTAAPASLEPPAAISLLQEGGLEEGKQYTGRRISL